MIMNMMMRSAFSFTPRLPSLAIWALAAQPIGAFSLQTRPRTRLVVETSVCLCESSVDGD